MGYLLLAGGAEFGRQMAEPDPKAMELAGGVDAPGVRGVGTPWRGVDGLDLVVATRPCEPPPCLG